MSRQKEELEHLRQKYLLRSLLQVDSGPSASVLLGGREVLLFCSNNYLGLANHPILKAAAVSAIQTWGVGAGASRLVSGNLGLYKQLEARVAILKRTESALVFSSGYAANIGAIGAIVKKGDLILADRLNHASLVDACRLSEGTFRVYRHKEMEQLERLLERRKKDQAVLIITDGIFSMDGDITPLREILHLADRYDAMVYLDDAHATGVLGVHGGGTADFFHLSSPRLIQMGTFSKALGGLGGFIAGSQTLIRYLINKARSFIYTTALPPSVLASAHSAIALIEKDPSFREKLWKNRAYFHEKAISLGFDTLSSETPIIPILIGESKKALAFSRRLLEKEVYLTAIRPPTVAEGTARLRITLTANHTKAQIDTLLNQLEIIGKELRLI